MVPALQKFKPELIVVPCGFDASVMDPLGHMMLTSDAFRKMTGMVMAAAQELCGGRLVMTHEGGYSAPYVPYCGLAVVETLCGVDTGIVDPWLEYAEAYAGQELMPHQAELIDKAKELVDGIKS